VQAHIYAMIVALLCWFLIAALVQIAIDRVELNPRDPQVKKLLEEIRRGKIAHKSIHKKRR